MSDQSSRASGLPDPDAVRELVIRELSSGDSLEELTELLHRSYKALADMGLRFVATYQDVATTRERISNGVAFVAVIRGTLVGTIVFTHPDHTSIPKSKPIPNAGKLNQLAVEPSWQGLGIGRRLFDYAEKYALSHGIEALVLDTAEQATHLISWYEKMGYSIVEYVKWEITNYRSAVLIKHLR
jgi:ribosomal protein S18 acetylase RimI-like enzyme